MTDESSEKTVREHVTTLHLIGEQLSQIESWFWQHLADVRDGVSPADPAPTDRDTLLSVVARIRQMTDYWEQKLPEVIRTSAVVSAIRAALEPVASPADAEPATDREALPPEATWMFGAAEIETRPEMNVTPLPAGALAADETVAPATDRDQLRQRIVETVSRLHDTGAVYALDAGEPERIADAVLAVLPAPTDRNTLRDRIADALIEWTYRGKDPDGGILKTVHANAYSRADAVLAVLLAPTDRDELRERIAEELWTAAERDIIAEWICCDPVNPNHDLCSQGAATLRMVRSLIFDGDRTLADAVLAVLPAPDQQAAEIERLRKEHATWRKLGQRNLERAHEENARLRAVLERIRVAVRRLAAHADRAATEERAARWETAALKAGREVDRNALRVYMAVADDEQAELRRLADEAQQGGPLRAELKPWQLLADQPDEALPQTERIVGGRRLPADTAQQPKEA